MDVLVSRPRFMWEKWVVQKLDIFEEFVCFVVDDAPGIPQRAGKPSAGPEADNLLRELVDVW